MKSLFNFINSKVRLTQEEEQLISTYFVTIKIDAQTILLKESQIASHIYFLESGVAKGYENIDGKNVIQQLVAENTFFTVLESFMHQKPSTEYLETITDCTVTAINKKDFDFLLAKIPNFGTLVQEVTNLHLTCKMERVKDFQALTAKQRYEKFLKQYPTLALQVSIENIASFLGMEPQSLSRIRKQLTF